MISEAEYYSKISGGYDELYLKEQMEKFEKLRKFVGFKKSDFVLDVGCGTGSITNEIKKNVKFVIGIDVSIGMVKLAKKKGIICVVADAENLPFKRDVFDKVICITTIQNIENQEKGMNEMERVCKKKGMVIITAMKRSKKIFFLRYLLKKGIFLVKDIGKDFAFVLNLH